MTTIARSFSCYLLVLVLPVLLAACTSTEPAAATALPPPAPELRVALVGDNSASADPNLVPRPTRHDVETMLALVSRHGGELAYTAVCVDSRTPLQRIRLTAPPVAPVEPHWAEGSMLREEQEAAFATERADYDVRYRAWKAARDEQVAAFLDALEPRLAAEPTCRKSDVFGAVGRAARFLAEPTTAGVEPKRALWLCTDGADNVRRPPIALPAGTTVVIVNASGAVNALASYNPVAFESLPASVRWMASRQE